MVMPGQYGELINHFNVLRTAEDMYGLPALGLSAAASPITDVWVSGITPTTTPLGTTASATPPGATTTTTPTAGATVCGTSFVVVPSANNGASLNQLHAVAAVTSSDSWAAGTAFDGTRLQTLIEHWDGNAWTISPSPTIGSDSNVLLGLAAPSSNDVWAAGYYLNASGVAQTLIEHWNGSAWTVSASPNSGLGANTLNAVAARAANDAWAVGTTTSANGVPQALIEHWNGSIWTVVSAPNGGPGPNTLQAISARAADDAWAVGNFANGTALAQTLILHWNGNAWAVSPSPNSGPGSNGLAGVSVLTASDSWAVGTAFDAGGIGTTLTEHWNGSAWTVVPSPNTGPSANTLNAVAAGSAADVWAVGTYNSSSNIYQSLVEHWDGSAWSIVSSPNAGAGYNHLTGVARPNGNDLWAVGTYNNPAAVNGTLITRATGLCPSPTPAGGTPTFVASATPTAVASITATAGVPSATATPTPLGPTATVSRTATAGPSVSVTASRTPAATTPTATVGTSVSATVTGTPGTLTPIPSATPTGSSTITATPCPIRFSDVTDTTAYYYTSVYYLACHGIISGYSDGTFRPFNNTTRAQMTKIVTLAFNLALVPPPAAGTFADVDSSNVFYQLIETAAAHNIVSGYTCGGVNLQTGQTEPCNSSRRPYFRPSNNVTRGQLTKIVVIGAGWTLHTPPNPTFSDVAPSNVFYPFIETAVCHSIIAGYNDGTFRPTAAASRSQIAKISYLAVTSSANMCSNVPANP